MNRLFLALCFFAVSNLNAQEITSPAKANGFSKPSSYAELSAFISSLDKKQDLVQTEIIAESPGGKNVYAVKISSTFFGKDPGKIKVLILAQQHGNEQSGKEGALLLISDLLKPENRHILDKADIAIIPQMNPDGSELNKRRNADTMDLNRNHLILTEPEVVGLHKFFDRYLFEVTVDCHEYFPYGETWHEYGYRNNSDLLLGTATNPNVSPELRKLSNKEYIPFLRKYLSDRGISNFIYSPGGPPEKDYIRHSTFDINDGRQSFAIQGTFSFIHEGLNGKDGFSDNLRHRAESQMYGMKGLIEYSCTNAAKIKKLVAAERKRLREGKPEKIAIQAEHVPDGKKLYLPLLSWSTGKDTTVIVKNYRPVVKSTLDVIAPDGYLIPKSLTEMTAWAEKHAFEQSDYKMEPGDRIESYEISRLDSLDFEGDVTVNPRYKVKELTTLDDPSAYIFLPTAQLKGTILVLALEPGSTLGLVTYKQFAHLLKPDSSYPFLRVIKKKP